jgi:hypothetical protein
MPRSLEKLQVIDGKLLMSLDLAGKPAGSTTDGKSIFEAFFSHLSAYCNKAALGIWRTLPWLHKLVDDVQHLVRRPHQFSLGVCESIGAYENKLMDRCGNRDAARRDWLGEGRFAGLVAEGDDAPLISPHEPGVTWDITKP